MRKRGMANLRLLTRSRLHRKANLSVAWLFLKFNFPDTRTTTNRAWSSHIVCRYYKRRGLSHGYAFLGTRRRHSSRSDLKKKTLQRSEIHIKTCATVTESRGHSINLRRSISFDLPPSCENYFRSFLNGRNLGILPTVRVVREKVQRASI